MQMITPSSKFIEFVQKSLEKELGWSGPAELILIASVFENRLYHAAEFDYFVKFGQMAEMRHGYDVVKSEFSEYEKFIHKAVQLLNEHTKFETEKQKLPQIG